jgi:hypothetical protein
VTANRLNTRERTCDKFLHTKNFMKRTMLMLSTHGSCRAAGHFQRLSPHPLFNAVQLGIAGVLAHLLLYFAQWQRCERGDKLKRTMAEYCQGE